jgi:hypothetical protein
MADDQHVSSGKVVALTVKMGCVQPIFRLSRNRLVCKLTIGVLAFALPTALFAAPCDLKVVVSGYAGRPVRVDVPVRVLGPNGQEIAKAHTTNGVAEFCDVGVQDFSLVVGNEMCGQVIIRLLHIRQRPHVIPVFYENCHAFRVPSGCQVLLRIQDPEGARLAGATAIGSFLRTARQSDFYGRVELGLPHPRGSTHYEVVVNKPGFRSDPVSIPCSRSDYEVEKTVILQRAAPGEENR